MKSNPITNLPPGLVRDTAEFIYAQAPYPVREIAVAGAIGLAAGIMGRAWNVSQTGLNQYILLLAPTGAGKEAMAAGINRILAAVKVAGVPTVDEFMGPSHFTSKAAYLRTVEKQRSFLSVFGEFGVEMQLMTHPKASPHLAEKRQVLLDLYNKSGHGNVLRGSNYASNNDSIAAMGAPSLSVLAEGTPETFYKGMSESIIADGFLPRWLLIEYAGPRPYRNKNVCPQPGADLTQKWAYVASSAQSLISKNEAINVALSPDADTLLDAFERQTTDLMNGAGDEVSRQLWNRAHLKALKLAALQAVGTNPDAPTITLEQAQWAVNAEVYATNQLSKKFDEGDVGEKANGEAKQEQEFIRAIYQYVTADYGDLPKLRTSPAMHADKVIPLSYLQQKLLALAAFRNDRIGASAALKRTIQNFLDGSELLEMGKADLAARYNKVGRAFVVQNPTRFVEVGSKK